MSAGSRRIPSTDPAASPRHPQRPAAWPALPVIAAILVMSMAGCRQRPVADALIITQLPVHQTGRLMPEDAFDVRYPAGSRVVLVARYHQPSRVRVLSAELHAAGSPVVSPDGQRALFMGKAGPRKPWQIYEASLKSGKPRVLTSMAGGAMDPAYLPDGRFVFSSPVPLIAAEHNEPRMPALFAQSLRGGSPEPLTHGLAGALDPTVLADGRILFVSGGSAAMPVTNLALFTINNDGTELSPYACQHDGPARIWHPRERTDGRVVFLASEFNEAPLDGRAQQVLTARPSSSRTPAFKNHEEVFRSIESSASGQFLVTARRRAEQGEGSFAVFQIEDDLETGLTPLFDDPLWHDVEAVTSSSSVIPMGRLSTIKPDESTGLMLCLNANDSTYTEPDGRVVQATHVRVITTEAGRTKPLGEVQVHPDGSFMIEVPSDVALGFEALDDQGRILRRLAPTVWVRPGENRTCIGCHEPHNVAPENRRPLAVNDPPVKLDFILQPLAQRASQP
jgi:hypothetical protein